MQTKLPDSLYIVMFLSLIPYLNNCFMFFMSYIDIFSLYFIKVKKKERKIQILPKISLFHTISLTDSFGLIFWIWVFSVNVKILAIVLDFWIISLYVESLMTENSALLVQKVQNIHEVMKLWTFFYIILSILFILFQIKF